MAYEAGETGRAAAPRLEKVRADSVFRASSSCSKILKDKKYFTAVKNFRANSVFQGKRKLSKILKEKKYIQYSEFRSHSVFQGKQKLLKHPGCKKYIKYSEKNSWQTLFSGQGQVPQKSWKIKIFQCSENFQGKRYFSGLTQAVKTSELLKIYISNAVSSGHSLFFRASNKLLKSPER